MLLDRWEHSLAECSDLVLEQLSDGLVEHTSPETHAAVVELATGIHMDAAAAVAELSALRGRLARELPLGLVAACAGMYPLGAREESRVSDAPRYHMLADSMRFLARREPTLALHVYVGVPDPEDAIRVMGRLRADRCCLPWRPTHRSLEGTTAGSARRVRRSSEDFREPARRGHSRVMPSSLRWSTL